MKRSIYADLSHHAAEVIYNNLCIKSTCFADEAQKPVPADCIVALDDDPTSALWAVWLYYRIYAAYGYYPGIICVGGFGPLSRIVNGNRSEAEVLRRVCLNLGVTRERLMLAPLGTNTGANVQAVRKMLLPGQNVIWSVTKRQSLRTERTVAKQAPELMSYYFVIEETLDEAAKLMNGKILCQKEVMYQELAGLLERCEKYAGTFQQPLDNVVEITPEIRWADKFLRRHYRLKRLNLTFSLFSRRFQIPNWNIRSVGQYFRLLREIKHNRQKMLEELNLAEWKMAENLHYQGLITPEQRRNMAVPEQITCPKHLVYPEKG